MVIPLGLFAILIKKKAGTVWKRQRKMSVMLLRGHFVEASARESCPLMGSDSRALRRDMVDRTPLVKLFEPHEVYRREKDLTNLRSRA